METQGDKTSSVMVLNKSQNILISMQKTEVLNNIREVICCRIIDSQNREYIPSHFSRKFVA